METCHLLAEIGQLIALPAIVSSIVGLFFQYGHKKKLALLKSDLDKLATEHQISYTSVYAKRAELLSEVYSKLVDAERIFTALTLFMEPSEKGESFTEIKQRRLLEANSAYFVLKEFYEINRLYFNNSICKDIDKILEIFNMAISRVEVFIDVSWDEPSRRHAAEELSKSFKTITKDPLPQVKAEISRQFREILGIKD